MRLITITTTKEPTFVVDHPKIASVAFAHCLNKERVQSLKEIPDFAGINHKYNKKLSTASEPVLVCKDFGSLVASVQLG